MQPGNTGIAVGWHRLVPVRVERMMLGGQMQRDVGDPSAAVRGVV